MPACSGRSAWSRPASASFLLAPLAAAQEVDARCPIEAWLSPRRARPRWSAAPASAPPPQTALRRPPAAPTVLSPHDPYPSTYHPYPGVPTAITGGTVFDGEGGRIENGTVGPRRRQGRRRSAARTRRSRPARRGSTRHGKWVTPGHHRHPQPSRRLSLARVEAHQDGNELTGPVHPDVWAEHSVWPQDPGFSRALANGGVTTLEILPGSGRPVRRPLGGGQERAGAHRPGDEVPRRALRPQDGLRRESEARLRQPQPDARQPHGQYRPRPRDLGARRRI